MNGKNIAMFTAVQAKLFTNDGEKPSRIRAMGMPMTTSRMYMICGVIKPIKFPFKPVFEVIENVVFCPVTADQSALMWIQNPLIANDNAVKVNR